MRVLIVGCGYVGIPLGAQLSQAGHEVFGLRRTASAAQALGAAGIQLFEADLTDPASLTHLPGPFDWVVNCAAASGGSSEEYRRLYVEGTRNLLQRLGEAPPRCYVYTSSTSVYGQSDGSWVREESLTDPVTETGQILLETEQLLLDANRVSGFPSVILRLAGIYGPGRGYWFKQFLNGRAKVEGDGRRFLNMIHQEDVAGSILAAWERGMPGEIYNVVDDEPVAQIALFAWLSQTLGKPMPASAPPNRLLRTRGVTNKRVSNRKLKDHLGQRLKFPTFREGFETVCKTS